MRVGDRVRVKKPKFWPLWLVRLFGNVHVGMEGNIIAIDTGKYSGQEIYGVGFNTKPKMTTGAFFADQLEEV